MTSGYTRGKCTRRIIFQYKSYAVNDIIGNIVYLRATFLRSSLFARGIFQVNLHRVAVFREHSSWRGNFPAANFSRDPLTRVIHFKFLGKVFRMALGLKGDHSPAVCDTYTISCCISHMAMSHFLMH